jgi:8-oxo-dGTP pyrophosphatase MutT (NUDIX family)
MTDRKIKSYGIILFTRGSSASSREPKFCIYNRRDTYAYYEYLRGFYDPRIINNRLSERLMLLGSTMTSEEKERIRIHTFDELWEDLFVHKYIYPYIECKEEARKKFNYTRENLLKIKSGNCILDTGWGFPKGKQDDKNELPKECAFREFEEETGYSRNDCEIWDIGPICESFVCYDGRTYETYYYIAESKKEFPVRYITTPKAIRKLTVSSESYDLKWVTYAESQLLLCPRLQLVLKKVVDLIT